MMNRIAVNIYLRRIALSFILGATPCAIADWNNNGGNAGRNGIVGAAGPSAATELWSGGRPSIIAWQPVIESNRAFMVRQTGFPPGGEANGSTVVAMDLNS